MELIYLNETLIIGIESVKETSIKIVFSLLVSFAIDISEDG